MIKLSKTQIILLHKNLIQSFSGSLGIRDENLLDSTLRFSFCENNTVEEAEYTVDMLRELLPMLRKFTRR